MCIRDSLFAADNREMSCEGTCTIKIEGIIMKCLVSSDIAEELVISWHGLIRMGVIPSNFPTLPEKGKIYKLKMREDTQRNTRTLQRCT